MGSTVVYPIDYDPVEVVRDHDRSLVKVDQADSHMR